MDSAKIGFQTHRFRDRVALYISVTDVHGKKHRIPTVYLAPGDARKVTRAINATARNVERFPKFSESPNTTQEFTLDGEA